MTTSQTTKRRNNEDVYLRHSKERTRGWSFDLCLCLYTMIIDKTIRSLR